MIPTKQSRHLGRGRMLVPLLIVLALPIAAMIALIVYHQKSGPSPSQPTQPPAAAVFGSDTWPIFRGDSQLTGCADGNLPKTLKPAWTFVTGAEINATAVIADQTAFVSSMDSHLYAIDLRTGTEKWRFRADGELEASPLIHQGVVYVGSTNGTFYAVDVKTGTARWVFDKAGKITGGANIAIVHDTPVVIFGSYDSRLYGLHTDGTAALTVEADNYINGAVAVSGTTAFFGSCDAKIYCVPLSNTAQVKTIDAESYVAANPTVRDGIVYGGSYDGLFLAADIATQAIFWKYNQTEDAFFSSPAIDQTSVYVGCRDGKLYCFDRHRGDVRWTFEAADNFDSSPVVCGSIVAVGNDDGRLYLIDAGTGIETFSYTLGAAVRASAAIADNTLLIGCANGTLYAFTAP